jgi:hypothetical protein
MAIPGRIEPVGIDTGRPMIVARLLDDRVDQ